VAAKRGHFDVLLRKRAQVFRGTYPNHLAVLHIKMKINMCDTLKD
jgi:hypothetical protein